MKRLLLALAAAAALWTAACNGGSGTTVLPPPMGGFTPASLSGTYAFATNGQAITSTSAEAPLSRVGSFVADGQGGIKGGVEDVNVAGSYTPAIGITGGGYTVGADGRGTLTLNLASGSSINFGLTLTSNSAGLMIDETFSATQASTGSGNFILQSAAPFTIGTVSGNYVFDFSGADGSGNPDSIIGEFNVNNGVVGGVQDENDSFTTPIPATPTPVSFNGALVSDNTEPADFTSFGRGVTTLNGIGYVFYMVDGTRIRFLSTTGSTMLSGDAVSQSNTIPANVAALNSGFAFVVAGASPGGGLIRIGRFTANGATVNNVLTDTNNVGIFTSTTGQSNASITLDPVNPGRGVVTFTAPTLQVPFTFVFYLSSATSGVIQDDTQSVANGATDVADGTIGAQTGNPFSGTNITGTYALNWSGLSIQSGVQDEEDFVGQTTVSSLALNGAADIYQFQSVNGPQPDNSVSGSIFFNGGDGTGDDQKRTTMTVNFSKNGQTTTVDFFVYVVNPQLIFFANTGTSSTRIVAGALQVQQ
jgi:hypothetical protein